MNIEKLTKKDNELSYISPNLVIIEMPVEEGFCTSSLGTGNNEGFGRKGPVEWN